MAQVVLFDKNFSHLCCFCSWGLGGDSVGWTVMGSFDSLSSCFRRFVELLKRLSSIFEQNRNYPTPRALILSGLIVNSSVARFNEIPVRVPFQFGRAALIYLYKFLCKQ